MASGVPHIPFEALDANYEIDAEAYLTYFCKMHKLFPKCKKMVMAVRNQIASSHHTLSGLLYDAVEDKLYTTRIYDIQPIIDPMGVGDAFVAAYIHAHQKWGDEISIASTLRFRQVPSRTLCLATKTWCRRRKSSIT